MSMSGLQALRSAISEGLRCAVLEWQHQRRERPPEPAPPVAERPVLTIVPRSRQP